MATEKTELSVEELAANAWGAVIRQPKEKQVEALKRALMWAKSTTLTWEKFEKWVNS